MKRRLTESFKENRTRVPEAEFCRMQKDCYVVEYNNLRIRVRCFSRCRRKLKLRGVGRRHNVTNSELFRKAPVKPIALQLAP